MPCLGNNPPANDVESLPSAYGEWYHLLTSACCARLPVCVLLLCCSPFSSLPQTLSVPTRFSKVPSTAAILREGMGTPAGDQCELFSQKLSQALAAPVFATYTLPEIPGLAEAVTLQVLQKIRAVTAASQEGSVAAPTAISGDADSESAAPTLPVAAIERVPAAAEDEGADAVS